MHIRLVLDGRGWGQGWGCWTPVRRLGCIRHSRGVPNTPVVSNQTTLIPSNTHHARFRRNVKGGRGGLVFKAHRLLHHSTLGLRVIPKKRETPQVPQRVCRASCDDNLADTVNLAENGAIAEAVHPREGPSWGYPMLVLGVLGSFLTPFCGHLLPKVDNIS